MSPDTLRAADDSVAEDRGYRNSLTKIEPYGIEHIPDVERHGKPRSQFFLWFAAGMNFPIVVLGFSATYFGLPFWAAVLAIILAGVISSAGMGYLSAMGVRLGVPQQMQGRGPLGFIGNLFPVAYVNVFAGIGWAAVTVILGGKAIALLTNIPFWISSLVLMAIQLVVAVIGYNLIHFLQRILSFVLVIGFIFITVIAAANGRIENTFNESAKGFDGVGGWIIFFGWFFSFIVAWMPFASDYSRYLPNTPGNRRGAGWATMLGNFITLVWMGILGTLLGSTTTATDSIGALKETMGPWAAVGLGVVALSSFTQNFLNVYGGAISIQALRTPTLVARLATPLRWVHAEWVDARLAKLTAALGRFASAPGALASSAAGAVMVQALLVAFYAAVARGLHIPVSPWHLAVMVPVSFIVQMIPISVNGFGVREATFVAFFALAGLGAEAAMLLSFMGTAVIMAWSLAGACVHLARRPS